MQNGLNLRKKDLRIWKTAVLDPYLGSQLGKRLESSSCPHLSITRIFIMKLVKDIAGMNQNQLD